MLGNTIIKFFKQLKLSLFHMKINNNLFNYYIFIIYTYIRHYILILYINIQSIQY